jgi:hypothetical protein
MYETWPILGGCADEQSSTRMRRLDTTPRPLLWSSATLSRLWPISSSDVSPSTGCEGDY